MKQFEEMLSAGATIEEIMKACNCSSQTVRVRISNLEKRGAKVERAQVPGTRGKNINKYTMTTGPVK